VISLPKPISRCLAVTVAGVLVALAAPAQAQRPNRIQGEVLVVLAKEEAGRIDPALANVPALRRPPFNAFRSMEVLSRPRVDLRVNRPTTVQLPNGRRLQLVLQQVMPDGRYRVRVSINRPNQNDYLPLLQVVASPGDPFFVAGQSHQGGTLVIGVRIGERRSTPAASSMGATRPTKRR
jgi:hypothetical protein